MAERPVALKKPQTPWLKLVLGSDPGNRLLYLKYYTR